MYTLRLRHEYYGDHLNKRVFFNLLFDLCQCSLSCSMVLHLCMLQRTTTVTKQPLSFWTTMLTLMPKQRYPSEVILIYGINTINVLSPKSDQHETSPLALENKVVMRIEHMIREDEVPLYFKSSVTHTDTIQSLCST